MFVLVWLGVSLVIHWSGVHGRWARHSRLRLRLVHSRIRKIAEKIDHERTSGLLLVMLSSPGLSASVLCQTQGTPAENET